MTVGKKDLSFVVKSASSGALSGWMRDEFKNLPDEKRLEEFQKDIAKDFSNPVSVKTVAFGNLELLTDTLQHKVNFVVKNEVVNIGDLETFKIPFYSTFVHTGAFPENEARKHTLVYRDYESTDAYHDEITIRLEEGKAFKNVPANTALAYGKTKYSLTFVKKADNVLIVTRHIECERVDIPATEYAKFRDFVLAVAEAEGKVLTFK